MSGVEIIGLVLGVLPLVISTAEDYKKGLEPLVRWKRFKFVFREFITSVDIQQQMFQLVLKKLLIRVQLPAEEKQKLLKVRNYEGWRQPATIVAMRARLGESHDACMDILRAMKADMQDLQEIMSLKDGSVDWAHPGEKQWKYQAKRIQFSFSENGTRTVQSLEKRIQDLKNILDLLDSTDDEESYSAKAISKDTTWTKLFESIKRHAINLHCAIKNGWKCNCEGIHIAGLQLQKRVGDDSASQFTMTFGSFPLPKNEQQNIYPRRRVLIVLKESGGGPIPAPQRSIPSPIQVASLDQLRTDFEAKLSLQPTTAALPTHARIDSSSSSISSRLTSFGSLFSKSDSNLTNSSTSTSNGTEIIVENNHWKKTTHLNPRPKARKGISFAMDLPTKPTTTEHPRTPCISSNQPNSQSKTPSPVKDPYIDVEIRDLCSTLKDIDPKATALGYLSDQDQQRYELRPLTEEVAGHGNHELISLGKLLATDGLVRLTRRKRHKVACILASSLLQLQNTPWLDGNLSKNNVLFYHQGNEVLAEQPYISHSFSSTKSPTQTSSENTTSWLQDHAPPRANLSSLGILLLELCWNQAIESQTELRKEHLSPDGQAIGGTDYLTAIDWLDKAKVDEEEPKMLPIIKWCIFCPFEGTPNWSDMKFTQAVYANVVRPLEMLVVAI